MNNEELAKILGIDKKGDQKITFVKTNFSPEKIGVTPVFNRMFYNANFKSEIIRINNDIKSAFTNLIKIGVHKNEIPMLSTALFNQLMVTIDSGNKEFIRDDSAPEFTRKELRKISEIQHKIYKVLFKIEEDLIDEQDTRIKDRDADLIEKIKKLLDERDAKLREELLKEIETRAGAGGGGKSGGIIDTILGIYKWYKLGMFAWDAWKAARWLYDKSKWLRMSRAQRIQTEIENQRRIQREAEERIRRAEERLGQSRTETERMRTEAERARAEAEKAAKKPTKPPRPVPSPNSPSVPDARASRPPTETAKKFPKMSNAFGKFMKAAGPLFAKATIALDIFVLLPMRVCEFWDLSMKPGDGGHLEFNFIERTAYSLTAGLTQWIEDHFRIVEDLTKLIKLVIDFFAENLSDIAGDGGGVFGLFADIAWGISFGIGKLLEKVVEPLTSDLIAIIKKGTGAATGDECGMCAVMLVNDIWDELTSLVKGSVPNEMTYQMITGENPVMQELQRKGIYKWNAFGESELKYDNVHDIAHKLTKSEIMTILSHDDVSVSLKRTLKEALTYKEKNNITDTDVYKGIYTNPYVDSLITVLNGSSAALESQWLKMIRGAVDQTREYLIRYGWISMEYNAETEDVKVIEKGPFPTDDDAESMFKYVFSRFKGQYAFLGLWSLKYEVLYFDIFGTLMNSGFSSVPPKNLKNRAPGKQYLKVLGYMDKQRQFHEGKSCPNDEIFEAVLKKDKLVGGIYSNNIVVDDVVAPLSSQDSVSAADIAGVSLPSHLAMTTGHADESGNLSPSSLPSHLAATAGLISTGSSATPAAGSAGSLPSHLANTFTPGLGAVTETYNFSGSESIPNLTQPGYTGTDYTSVEAIKKARVYEKGGKWFSDNPFVDAIIQIESMRNASARPYNKKQGRYLSSAAGLFQFLKGTGEKFGLRSLQDRMNPYKSLEAFKLYVLENMRALKQNGIPVTPANLYLSHQQGAAGFNAIYKFITGKTNSLSQKLRSLMAGNSHGHPYKSPQDWYRNWANDIAKLMGQAPQMPQMAQPPEHIQSYSAGSESPGDYSESSGSTGSLSPGTGASQVFGQKAPEGAPSYVQDSYSLMEKSSGTSGGSGMAMAAKYARQHARGKSIGYCAKYVANALQYAGVKFTRQPSAYMYHTNGVLKKAGFGLVSVGRRGYSPQVGDVCVINKFNKHKHGHICIWDGRNWISDFIQKNPSPYSDGPGDSGIFFYRYGGSDLQVDESFEGNDSYPATNSETYSKETMASPDNTTATPNSLTLKNRGTPEIEGETEMVFKLKAAMILGG